MLVVACTPAASAPSPSASQAAIASASAAAPSVEASAAPSKQDITLTVMASQEWIKPAEQELAKKFEAETGIHVDYQIIPADQYFNVLKTKLNAGEATDIFGGQSGKSDLKLQYDVENNAVDLTGEEWTKRIDPAALDQSSLDGKVYGAEIWDIVASNYFVIDLQQGDLLRSSGSRVPKTFDEFADGVRRRSRRPASRPIYEPISDGWHHVLWFPMVGPRFEEAEPGLADKLNANQATFAGDANTTTAMTQINQLYQSGCFGDNALSDTFADTNKAMASGKYAMTVVTALDAGGDRARLPGRQGEQLRVLPDPDLRQPAPAGPPGRPDQVHLLEVAARRAGKQYLDFLMQPDNLQYLLDNTPQFATLPFTGVEAKWDADQKAFLDTYPAKTLVYQDAVNYVNPQWIDIGQGHGQHVHGQHDARGGDGEHRRAAHGDGEGRQGSGLAELTSTGGQPIHENSGRASGPPRGGLADAPVRRPSAR